MNLSEFNLRLITVSTFAEYHARPRGELDDL